MATVLAVLGFAKKEFCMPTGEPTWYKKRGYLHFDAPLGVVRAGKLVRNPKTVAHHAFFPLLRYQVDSKRLERQPKGKLKLKKKSRPISYAAHADSQIYSYYSHHLNQQYENRLSDLGISDCVLAFRKLKKSNVDFAHEAFMEISSEGNCAAIALDVSKFFDNLNHVHLKQQWSQVLGLDSLPEDHFSVFKSLTKFSYCDRSKIFEEFSISPNKPWSGRQRICEASEFRSKVRGKGLVITNLQPFGIPQGTPISALLSNIYMLEFDSQMHALAQVCGGSYRRYCDDMLFIVKQGFESEIESHATKGLRVLGISINPKKTEIRRFWRYGGVQKSDKPLQYLGFTFDGQRILLRSAALAKFSGRMNKAVRLISRTLNTARSEGKDDKLRKKKLYDRYSHLGHRNFIRYGLRSAKIMDSKAIKRQLKPLWGKLNSKLDELK